MPEVRDTRFPPQKRTTARTKFSFVIPVRSEYLIHVVATSELDAKRQLDQLSIPKIQEGVLLTTLVGKERIA